MPGEKEIVVGTSGTSTGDARWRRVGDDSSVTVYRLVGQEELVDKLRAERDEARTAARGLYAFAQSYGPDYFTKGLLFSYPWLEEE